MALKSTYTSEEKGAEIEEALDALDALLDRVKVLYEQYFMGIQRQPPTHLHTTVERQLRELQQEQIRNTALRYRFITLQQKHGAYNSYWKRTLREIEGGRYLRNLSRRYLGVEPLIIGENAELGVDVRIDKPSEAGADRLVNAIGAHIVYPGPLIVIDSGTATTFDIVAADGGFEGGIIAPGVNLSMQALHDAAAKLPRIAIQRPERNRVVGTDTVTAMQSGVFWGYIGLIEGLIARIKAERGEHLTVVATGGVVSLFEGATEMIDHYDPDLTIRGLLEIHRRNAHLRA